MAQLITVRLNKSDQQPLGFRLQGGKDFGTPLVVQKVNGGSSAERAGLQAGDALIRVNNTDVYTLRHQEAQDTIRAAGPALELTVQRGGGTWRPSVTPTGSLPRPGSRPLGSNPVPVTNTSLKATPQPARAFGSGHNSVAKPFGYMNGNDSVKSIVNKQYNTPVNIYSDKTIAETLSAQTEVLAGGVLGVNFKKNEKTYDAEKSAVFKVLQEEQNDPEPVSEVSTGATTPVSGLRHVAAPVTRPDAPVNNTGGLPPGQNICEECERLITGVFVHIKDKNLHVECFKCATCGSPLKNQGYYNLNGKLYCDIHAKLVARQNPPAANLEPVTVPPGGRIPTNAYSTPLPPLSTNNYTNGSSSMFSPSSNLSGPKPFGSSIGSAYSPASLSPRSAPLSPARPLAAPAPAPAPAQHFAPTQNVKSIVWPPPNPPEDESQTELNPNTSQNIHYSDSAPVAHEPMMISTTDFNPTNMMKSTAGNLLSSQSSGFSSNIAMTTSQATSITESLVQSQKSQIVQEMSSCSVQSFSQQASSESQSFTMFQTHKASDQMDSQMNKKVSEKMSNAHDKQSFCAQSEYGKEMKEMNMKMQETQLTNPAVKSYNDAQNQAISFSNKTENTIKNTSLKTSAFEQKSSQAIKPSAPQKKFEGVSPAPSKMASETKVSSDKKLKKTSTQPASASKTPQASNRLSLLEALTIAPDRPFSPLSFNIPTPQYLSSEANPVYQESSDAYVPLVTQTDNYPITNQSEQNYLEQNILSSQNTCTMQKSSTPSAFKPVRKQVFPPPQPQEFSAVSETSTQKETKLSENITSNSQYSFSPVQSYQNQDAHSNKESSLKTGLHRPESIPSYQQNLDLPLQRGQSPEFYITQNTEMSNQTHNQHEIERKVECRSNAPKVNQQGYQGFTSGQQTPSKMKSKDTPDSFQPVLDEGTSRNSPVLSRPTTPSMINKPAPIIPRYQMNLVTVEHSAPEGRMYKPHGSDTNQSSSPKPRPHSPAPGPPSNPLKAHAPRIKENTTCASPQSQFLKKEHDLSQESFQESDVTKWLQDQPPLTKQEMQSNVEYHSESYNKGDLKIKEDSMINQNYGQRQMQSQNISEHGNTTIQTTRKTFEEYENVQSAKVVEIHHGDLQSSGAYQQLNSNVQQPHNNLKQVYPPPILDTTSSQQNLSINTTNENFATASKQTEMYQPIPVVSGANKDPVCDPTPSTGSGVGATPRGKAFGVSSAPKRGRGVLNKAALPGSRVPLCASCNGNIRGPFITALGRIWCPEHFICVNATCRRPLQDIGFVEENGQLYCEYCFEQYIAPACDKCHAKIKGDCLNAIGKHFHPECFSCVYCGKLFGNNPFFLEDGLPYCESDWNELFTTKCFACGFPVEAGDRWVEALNNNYHSQCFNCTVCKKNLEGQSFFAKGGRPFCKIHAR